MIHELFHGAPNSGSWYHTQMAQAAYNVAAANPSMMSRLKNTNHAGPPRAVDYTGEVNKADDWYNAGIFDAVVKIGCPIPPQ